MQERRLIRRNSSYLTEQKAQAQTEGEWDAVAAALHTLQHAHVVFLWGNRKLKGMGRRKLVLFSHTTLGLRVTTFTLPAIWHCCGKE